MRAKVNSGASRRDAERAAPVAGPPLRGARCRAPCSSLSVRLPVLPPTLVTQYVDTRRKPERWGSRTRAAARGADLDAESVKLRRRATQVRAREDLSSTAGARTHVALVLATPREHAGSGATSNAELEVGAHGRPGLDDVLGSTPHSVPPGGGASSIRQATYHRRTPGSPPCASYSRTCGVRAKCRQFSKARQSGLPLHAHAERTWRSFSNRSAGVIAMVRFHAARIAGLAIRHQASREAWAVLCEYWKRAAQRVCAASNTATTHARSA